MQKLMVYIGYTAGVIFVALGIAIMATELFPTTPYATEQVKTIFGVVMILYGLYRIVIITIKNHRANEEETE
ncbi:MAG: hypothetical protein Q8L04_19255 [Ignavibacteria bacterium]|nr:hypothetical protein [Ignavibacteria bacterium]